MQDRREHSLAAEVIQSSHTPVVRIQVVTPGARPSNQLSNDRLRWQHTSTDIGG
jgi:hypothetical protein